MVTPQRIPMAQILAPRSVAILGASNTPGKFGYGIMKAVTAFGFAGGLFPVNPRAGEIWGLPGYATIADVPGPVDVAIIALPPETMVAAVRDCAEAGVGACVIVTTGFSELDAQGGAREEEIAALARTSGMRIMGPNCMGFLNPAHRLPLTSSVVFDTGRLLPGKIGLISQSGGLMVTIYDRAMTEGIGFSACVSLGNQCDVEFCDVLEFMIDDPATAAICLYVEGFRSPRRFLDLAERCRTSGKPLLLVKSGRTEAGARAALSHTASLAGSYTVLAAACHPRGVVLMDDPDDMLRAADALVRFGRPSTSGVGLVSTSGGSMTIGVDRLVERGLSLASLGAGSLETLQATMQPGYGRNPVDLGGRTGSGTLPDAAAAAVRIMAADPAVGVLLVLLSTARPYTAACIAAAQALLACGKPFAVVLTPGQVADEARRSFREMGCPYFNSLDNALRVLTAITEAGAQPGGMAAPKRPRHLAALSAAPPAGRLTEAEVKALAEAYGVQVTPGRVCADVEAAVEAAGEIGFPVVMKAVCRALVHKSDAGVVALDVGDADGVRAAWAKVMAALDTAMPGAACDGVLVQAMWRGEAELLVGARRESDMGVVVVVGLGGIATELYGDVQVAPAPVDAEQAMKMLQRLRCWPLLSGFRGKQALDALAAAEVISRVSWLAADLGERLVELELNPVMVRPGSGGACAVDGRATLL